MVGPGCHFGWAWLVLSLMLAAHLPGHAAEPLIRVGVIRSNPIPVFERVQKGFEAGLESSGFKEGVNISFDIQNTGGDAARAEATVSKFAADKGDLVHSIGTLPTLAAVKQSRLPVVFSAVTDPVSAGIVVRQVSGDRAPRDNRPDKQNVGLATHRCLAHCTSAGTVLENRTGRQEVGNDLQPGRAQLGVLRRTDEGISKAHGAGTGRGTRQPSRPGNCGCGNPDR